MFCQRAASVLLLLVSVVKVFADSGYRGTLLDWVVSVTGGHARLQVVKPAAGRVGFGVDPKRWIVERTIGWLSWSGRLRKDYEQRTGSAEAWIEVSAMRCALRKLEPF